MICKKIITNPMGDSLKVMLWIVLLGLCLSGCITLQEDKPQEKPPVQVATKIDPEELKELPRIHKIHSGEKINAEIKNAQGTMKCSICHDEKTLNYKSIPSMSVCLGCHTGQNASQLTCARCHSGTKKIFSGTGGIGVELLESEMADIDCETCHEPENKYKVSGEICLDCHDEMINQEKDQIQAKFEEKLEQVESYYRKIFDIFLSSSMSMKEFPELEIGKYNYRYAQTDRSKGIHNGKFVMQLISEAEKNISKAEKILLNSKKSYEENIQQLVRQTQADDPLARLNAVIMLAKTKDVNIIEPLIQTLQDPDRRVRQKAVSALGAFGDDKVLMPIIQALKDPDSKVREAAVNVLGNIGDERALKPLNRARNDSDANVRLRADAAFNKIKNLLGK